jgi:hypothetical protein
MKQTILGKTALAAAVFTCASMLSFDGNERKGVSLSIERAYAQMQEPASPSVTPRRSARRAGRATAMGADAAAVAAGAVAAGATAANYAGGGPYVGGAYYSGPGVWSQDYAARNGIICQPGTLIRLEDGLMHRCQ